MFYIVVGTSNPRGDWFRVILDTRFRIPFGGYPVSGLAWDY